MRTSSGNIYFAQGQAIPAHLLFAGDHSHSRGVTAKMHENRTMLVRPGPGQSSRPFTVQRIRVARWYVCRSAPPRRGLPAKLLLLAIFAAGVWPTMADTEVDRAQGSQMSPPPSESSTAQGYHPPPSCTRWFDGCNDCERVGGGRPPICTQRMCPPGAPKPGYCKATE